MKPNFPELQAALNKLQYFLIIGVVITMTFDMPLIFTTAKFNNLFTVLAAANAVLIYFINKTDPRPRCQWLIILFLSLYAAYVLGLAKSDNLKQGFSDLTEKKIALFVFPVLFYLVPRFNPKQVKNILLSFVAGCLLTVIFCSSVATYRFLTLGTTEFFTYHAFSQLAGMHAVYLAMFCCFSIGILVSLYPSRREDPKFRKLIFVLALMILTVSIFLLAGRTHIAILIIGATAYFFTRLNKTNNLLRSVIKASLIAIVITGIAFLFPTNRLRFKQAINYNNEFGLDRQWGEQQMRPLMWKCAFELIRKHPLTGWGIGDNLDELHQCYTDRGFTSLTYLVSEGVRFNAHNQFLEISITLGVLGLVFFITTLAVSLLHAFSNKKALYLFFLLLFIVSCLTESLLERQAGCVFYGFFNSFLFYYDRAKNDS